MLQYSSIPLFLISQLRILLWFFSMCLVLFLLLLLRFFCCSLAFKSLMSLGVDILVFILVGACDSWLCRWTFFIKFGMFDHSFFKFSFCSPYSFWESQYIYVSRALNDCYWYHCPVLCLLSYSYSSRLWQKSLSLLSVFFKKLKEWDLFFRIIFSCWIVFLYVKHHRVDSWIIASVGLLRNR